MMLQPTGPPDQGHLLQLLLSGFKAFCCEILAFLPTVVIRTGLEKQRRGGSGRALPAFPRQLFRSCNAEASAFSLE